jgi:undecaprenyl pyrophosphate phosphatase UppP
MLAMYGRPSSSMLLSERTGIKTADLASTLPGLADAGSVGKFGPTEGLTEFLPGSSTGHIILAEEVLHFQGPPGKVFEIVIQLGAILAICFLYRAKIFTTVSGVLRREPVALRFALAVFVAFLPAAC